MALHLLSTGIDFQDFAHVAGGDKELLDDYEEGDWTPTDTNDGGSSAEGRYTKIGDLIRAHFVFTTGSLSGTGQFQIKAFPFTCGTNDKHRGAVCVGYTNASNWPIVGGLIGNNGTTAYVLIGSGNIAENGEIGTSKTITGTITYSTN